MRPVMDGIGVREVLVGAVFLIVGKRKELLGAGPVDVREIQAALSRDITEDRKPRAWIGAALRGPSQPAECQHHERNADQR